MSGGANERPKATDWIQALSGTVAVLFAAAALIVATYTYRDQQQINRDQLTLNNAARQRTQQRFAARVAWWTEVARGGERNDINILIQNRSPVPIREVRFAVDAGFELLIANADDIPPCAIRGYRVPVTYDVASGLLLTGFGDDESYDTVAEALAYGIWHSRADLHFSDSERYWVLTPRGLMPDENGTLFQRPKEANVVDPRLLEEIPALAAAAADCGEGG
ncbi:hypothetical protein WEI85_18015 [Actinomycetes bacterium KLBMP 9797]